MSLWAVSSLSPPVPTAFLSGLDSGVPCSVRPSCSLPSCCMYPGCSQGPGLPLGLLGPNALKSSPSGDEHLQQTLQQDSPREECVDSAFAGQWTFPRTAGPEVSQEWMELAPPPSPDCGLAALPLLRGDWLWGPCSPPASPLGAHWLCCILGIYGTGQVGEMARWKKAEAWSWAQGLWEHLVVWSRISQLILCQA